MVSARVCTILGTLSLCTHCLQIGRAGEATKRLRNALIYCGDDEIGKEGKWEVDLAAQLIIRGSARRTIRYWLANGAAAFVFWVGDATWNGQIPIHPSVIYCPTGTKSQDIQPPRHGSLLEIEIRPTPARSPSTALARDKCRDSGAEVAT